MDSKLVFVQVRNSVVEKMYEDSENSIQNVIQSLSWNDSIYRTFNEGLKLARNAVRRRRIPKSLVDYIHRAHVSYVTITLRKLYDDKMEGTRAVNSLRTVTQKILDNVHLFTRENYVTYDGTPYQSEGRDWRSDATTEGRHREFDLLCRLGEGRPRRSTDKADRSIAEQIHSRTALRPEIEVFANKFLAHSSSKRNRPNESMTFANLSLLRIQSQYRNAVWSSQQIGKYLCQAVLTEVATPQFDVLEDWEHGLFDEGIKSQLHYYWEGRVAWWHRWTTLYRNPRKLFLSPGERL